MNNILKKLANAFCRHLLLSGVVMTVLAIGTIGAQGQIATGTNHTLAVQNNGTVWAWGYNFYGQLGNNTTTEETTAMQVQTLSGTLANAVDVSAGLNHSIAMDKSGNVWAWGYNSNGQLGNGTTTNSSVAVQVQLSSGGNLTSIIAIAAGDSFSVALRNDGTVWAWGYNSNGQLGNGTTTQETKAVQVTGLAGIVAISAGATHTMALDSSGNVWTWGNNGNGQLGLGTTTQETTPQEVTAITGISQIAAGASHSLAMSSGGSAVYAWGSNSYGQLGNNTTTQETSPVQMIGVSGAQNVAAGLGHSVILESNGTVLTVGHNYEGELGLGNTTDQHEAVQVSGVSGVMEIAARGDRTLIYTNLGTILGAGDDFYSGLGDGKLGYQLSPYSITALTGTVTHVSSAQGGYHSLAVKSDGTLWAAGWNNDGQLGTNNLLNSDTFVQVTSGAGYLTGAIAASAGANHSLAVTSSNTVWAWGYNYYGQLGNGANTNVQQPVQVVTATGTLTGVTAVSAGSYHSLALTSSGNVWAWGDNADGQLGNNTTTNSNKAVEVLNTSGTALNNIVAIAAGSSHSLAVDSSGNLWAWGYNNTGQLGDGTTTNHLEAEQINLSGATVKAVAAGIVYSLAIKSDNTVLAWGANNYGDLGDGTTTTRLTPVAVQNLTSVASISAGQYHSVATETNGSVWTWGTNSTAQLGNGTFDLNSHASPVQITGITAASGANAGSAGGYHTLLINSSGVLTVWANGMYGQLGDNQFGYAVSPVTAAFTITPDTSGLWVDGTNGLDTNAGTFSLPFKTIAAAVAKSEQTGDTDMRITLRAGTYHEQLLLHSKFHAKSGTAGNPFIVRGMPGERAIISGMRPISGWSLYSGNIYVANLGTWDSGVTGLNPYGPDTFYMGMNEKLMAQSPNVGTGYWAMQSYTTASGTITITDTAHLSGYASNSLVGGYVQWSSNNVTIEGGRILANNPTAGTITAGYANGNVPPLASPNGTYIIKNSLQLLDAPGEWACIAQTDGTFKMYYWPENSTEVTNLLSSTPTIPPQSRDGDYSDGGTSSRPAMVYVYGVSYITLTGMEIMGATGGAAGIYVSGTSTAPAQGVTIYWNTIHDNGGDTWSGGEVNEFGGAGVSLLYCTNALVSNNSLTLNYTGVSVNVGCSGCTVQQNDIGYNYNDAIDIGGESSAQNMNTLISENYLHHNIDILQHADSVQNEDIYIQGETIQDNVMLDQEQMTFANGFGGGTLLLSDNVIWNTFINGLGEYTGTYAFNNNTCNGFSMLSNYPLSCNDNVDWGRWVVYAQSSPALNYTGDRNLVIPAPTIAQTGAFDTVQLVAINGAGQWALQVNYQSSPAAFTQLYNLTGLDQHSLVLTTPATPQFKNMPIDTYKVDYSANMANFSTNSTSTTVPLVGVGHVDDWNHNPAAAFEVNDWIEVNRDGIYRQVSAVNTTNNTITFSPPLSGFAPGDGLGWANLARYDFIDRWGQTKPSSLVYDTTLAAGTPGTTMSSTGGPIGSTLSIPSFQLDNFDGSGPGEVPTLPPDVQTNQQRHSWHLSTWFSYGNN